MERKCHECGEPLPVSALFYQCQVEFISGYDEDQPYSGDEADENIDTLVARLEEQDAQDVMDDVYQKIAFVLCPACRKRMARELQKRFARHTETKQLAKIVPLPPKKDYSPLRLD